MSIETVSPEELAIRERVDAILASLDRPMVALSGGVDSALLAARAMRVGGAAATLTGKLYPATELERARATAEHLGIRYFEITVNQLAVPEVQRNEPDRCYHCRRAGMTQLLDLARREGYGQVVDGDNADDADDYRPGVRAMRELGFRGPFREAGMTKAMIRRWAAELGLPTARVPAAACLATRIPFGTPLSDEALRRVERAEAVVAAVVPGRVRVRDLGGVA
ncbi:MAG: ATP-dependent sacrificial sulfur transferase LarE [Planctomycetes bacterium]|nr:ATP-dependent sacrificial sulfur transferase LarE [Planctomycetota bacterium]